MKRNKVEVLVLRGLPLLFLLLLLPLLLLLLLLLLLPLLLLLLLLHRLQKVGVSLILIGKSDF